MSTILVTGASGNVGRQVVAQLLEAGAEVRALTRDPASARLPAAAEVVRGDLADAATLPAALRDVEAVFLLWPLLSADAAPAALAAIARQRRRVVYLSSMSVRDGVEQQAEPISQMHADLEREIAWSGVAWTFLRAGGFAANTLGWAPQIRAGDVVRWPSGAAARSLVHERDLAAVAVRALTEEGHEGRRYVLTGPEAVTQVDQVQTIGDAIGRPLRFEELSRAAAREELSGVLPPALLDGALDAWAAMAREPEPVSAEVEQLTGAPARSFASWAADHAADFG